MNSIVLAFILTAIAFCVASLKNTFKDMPAALIFIMLALDGLAIFGFHELGVTNIAISIGIALSTPLKIFIFMIKTETNE